MCRLRFKEDVGLGVATMVWRRYLPPMLDLDHIVRERVSREWGPGFVAGGRRVAMCYPSPYRVGMSSLGFQELIRGARRAGVAAERCFLPDDPAAYRAARRAPFSYETHTPLHRFPLLAVSLAYELEIMGLFELLALAGIPALRAERSDYHPMVLLGGPISMANPLCAAPFVDAMLLGEAEVTGPSGLSAFFDCDSREAWLDHIESLPGGYVPERHGSRLPMAAQAPDALLPAHSLYVSPDTELSNMFLVEAERGCHRTCTFCVMRRVPGAGMRKVAPEVILEKVPDHVRKVGLVGAAVSDHPGLVPVLEELVASGRSVSLSSLRADRVRARPRIAELLRESGARTLTVASDGASKRLRRWMSKGTKEVHLIDTAKKAGELGFSVFKVYMMLGLPPETDEDIEELIAFSQEVARAAGRTRLALGIAPFVAKRNTPLDGEPFAGIKVVDRRLKRLRRALKGVVEIRPTSARWAWVEYELSQGGPEAGLAMYQAYQEGGRFAAVRRALQEVPEESRRPWAAQTR